MDVMKLSLKDRKMWYSTKMLLITKCFEILITNHKVNSVQTISRLVWHLSLKFQRSLIYSTYEKTEHLTVANVHNIVPVFVWLGMKSFECCLHRTVTWIWWPIMQTLVLTFTKFWKSTDCWVGYNILPKWVQETCTDNQTVHNKETTSTCSHFYYLHFLNKSTAAMNMIYVTEITL